MPDTITDMITKNPEPVHSYHSNIKIQNLEAQKQSNLRFILNNFQINYFLAFFYFTLPPTTQTEKSRATCNEELEETTWEQICKKRQTIK
jgi:hypothetical protein